MEGGQAGCGEAVYHLEGRWWLRPGGEQWRWREGGGRERYSEGEAERMWCWVDGGGGEEEESLEDSGLPAQKGIQLSFSAFLYEHPLRRPAPLEATRCLDCHSHTSTPWQSTSHCPGGPTARVGFGHTAGSSLGASPPPRRMSLFTFQGSLEVFHSFYRSHVI